jgi:hypothetical protein
MQGTSVALAPGLILIGLYPLSGALFTALSLKIVHLKIRPTEPSLLLAV